MCPICQNLKSHIGVIYHDEKCPLRAEFPKQYDERDRD